MGTKTPERLLRPQKEFYIISNTHRRMMDWVARRSKDGDIINIVVEGPHGCGKSELVSQFAAHHDRPLAVIEVGLKAEAAEWFGKVDIVDGNTVYEPSIFTEAIQTPGCVVHLQELNRPEQDSTLNSVFSVLDPKQRSLYHDEWGTRINVAPGVVIFATMNSGYEFIGTIPLDEALRVRFAIKLRLNYPQPQQEATILTNAVKDLHTSDAVYITGIIDRIRYNTKHPLDVSIRTSITIAQMYQDNISLYTALNATIAAEPAALESVLVELSLSSIQQDKFGDSTEIIDAGSEPW